MLQCVKRFCIQSDNNGAQASTVLPDNAVYENLLWFTGWMYESVFMQMIAKCPRRPPDSMKHAKLILWFSLNKQSNRNTFFKAYSDFSNAALFISKETFPEIFRKFILQKEKFVVQMQLSNIYKHVFLFFVQLSETFRICYCH